MGILVTEHSLPVLTNTLPQAGPTNGRQAMAACAWCGQGTGACREEVGKQAGPRSPQDPCERTWTLRAMGAAAGVIAGEDEDQFSLLGGFL